MQLNKIVYVISELIPALKEYYKLLLYVLMTKCTNQKTVFFIHFCEATYSMQYRPPNAYQEISNTNHFGHCHF